jgi:hypothetical protein
MSDNNNSNILHVGYGKTATTWFQKVFYPQISDIEFYDLHKIRTIIKTEWDKINDHEKIPKLLKKTDRRLIICDESMIGSNNTFRRNVKLFKQCFYPSQIIIFIRNQNDKYISNYSQYIKFGGTLKFKDFLFHEEKIFNAEKHCYDIVIDLYKENFGESNVYVYLYEEFHQDFDRFLKTFCSNHSLKINTDLILNRKINVKLSYDLIRLKRLSNHLTKIKPSQVHSNNPKSDYKFHIPFWFQITLVGFNLINKIYPTKNNRSLEDFIGKDKAQIVKKYFTESNNKLIKKHGLLKVRDYNYPL